MSGLSGNLTGVVDRASARILSGWVIDSQRMGDGRDIVVSVSRDGRLIGEARLEYPRPDIADAEGCMAGFRLTCTENIPDEAIAFDLLRILARDSSGRSGQIGIIDHERAIALTRLLRSAPPFGKNSASAILSILSRSPALPDGTKQALAQCRDTYFETSAAAASAEPKEGKAVNGLAEPGSAQDQDRLLMYQFESLGKNCVLGGVQRSFGAEPLGLLRFAGIDVDAVTRAINDRFNGVGSPEFTRLLPQDTNEYYTYDTRYHMAAHTFVFDGEVDFDQFYPQQCKRIAYLARNILEDIEEGKKILVIHAMPDGISETKLQALHDAIRKAGAATLLYVQQATEVFPPGTVVRRDDSILTGYVLHRPDDELGAWKSARESWLAVCRAAYKIVSGLHVDRYALETQSDPALGEQGQE